MKNYFSCTPEGNPGKTQATGSRGSDNGSFFYLFDDQGRDTHLIVAANVSAVIEET